jgi:endonuclease/exonuclease/phosphatase family metal-dependent hydrolase
LARDPAFLAECRGLVAAIRRHPTLAALHASPESPELGPRLAALLSTIRRAPPGRSPAPARDPARVRAVHWNIEHGNWYPQVERALSEHPDLAGADLVTLNEADLGMARSGNRDVAGDLAGALGLHAAWAPLFLETTHGRHDDAREAAGRGNEESLFGIAILSRWPMSAVRIVELPSPARFQYDTEGMYGRFVALVATIERPAGAYTAISAHLEVHRTRGHRAEQVRTLVGALRDERLPIVLGGDFNTHTFDRGRSWDPLVGALVLATWPGPLLRRRLLWPDRGGEPLFGVLREAGFEWDRTNDRQPTLHLRFVRVPEAKGPLDSPLARLPLRWAQRRAHLRLDWLAGRGWRGGSGWTVRGLDGPGRASDHAPLVGDFW